MAFIRLIRRIPLGVLLTSWALLIIVVLGKLVMGGPAAVEKYFWQLMYNHGDLGPVPNKVEWALVALALSSYALLTLTLLFFELRARKGIATK